MTENDTARRWEYITGDDLVSDVARYLKLDSSGDRSAWYALQELRDAYPSVSRQGRPDATSSPAGYKLQFVGENGTGYITVGLPRTPAPEPVDIGDEELPEGYDPRTDT